jgi:hypothetical protein
VRFFVLTATYELRVSRKNHLRDHPTLHTGENRQIEAKQRQKSASGKKKDETEILMQLSEQY